MTADFHNLSLATPFPANETMQTTNNEGFKVSHIGNTILKTLIHLIKLISIFYVPKLSQSLLTVQIKFVLTTTIG